MPATDDLTEGEKTFLRRFIGRGWLSAEREDTLEKLAVQRALRRGYLRRELSEVHFTPAGRIALQGAA